MHGVTWTEILIVVATGACIGAASRQWSTLGAWWPWVRLHSARRKRDDGSDDGRP